MTLLALLGILSVTTASLAQGRVNFSNSSATLISAGGASMPGANTSQFIFAVFLAPSDTVDGPGQTVAFDDTRFQLAGAYNTNHPTAPGRLVTRNNVDVTSAGGNPNHFGGGSTVDFVVRGWSANAGATWQEALSNYYGGALLLDAMYIGSSTVGDDFILGDGFAIPNSSLFGVGASQVGGFNMTYPPLDPPCPNPHLTMLSPLTNQTVIQGGTVIFNFWYSACPFPVGQVWGFMGNPNFLVSGTSQLVINNAQPTNAGVYIVQCYNYWGGTWHTIGSSASLTVLVPATITSAPVSQTAEIGARVRLAVRATGDPPLVYRWMFNGANVLSGETNTVLELVNTAPSQSGNYTVVVTNAVGAVTSAPAMLNVIALVERRLVSRLTLSGQLATPFNLEYSEALAPTQSWASLSTLDLTNSPGFYFDLASPLPPQRFYRAWQPSEPTNPPALGLNLIPALTLTGNLGDQVRVDGINQFGPVDAWFTLDTVTLTNTSQLYFDVTALRQPQRLYRFVPVL